MDDANNKTKETGKLAQDLGFTFQSAFEDAIIQGEKLRNVLKGLAQDILRIAIRKAVTEPLGNLLGGFFGGLFSFGKAQHGGLHQGLTLVGEQGPELVDFRRPARVYPNTALRNAGSGGGAPVFNFPIHIESTDGSGVRAAVAEIEARVFQAVTGALRGQTMTDLGRVSPTRRAARG